MKVLKDLKMKRVKMNVPADTGRKLNVHKTLRRRPGRLLNVLCTFNLRPVSTGPGHCCHAITSKCSIHTPLL